MARQLFQGVEAEVSQLHDLHPLLVRLLGSEELKEFVELILNKAENKIWAWFERNRDNTLFKKKVWFFKITIKVHDLEPMLRALFDNDEPPEIEVT